VKPFVNGVLDHLGAVPGLGPALRTAHGRHFVRSPRYRRSFHGIYPDFALALQAVPPGRAKSTDEAEAARRMMDDGDAMFPNDYPMLFWLSRCVDRPGTVFDWGGYAGRARVAFSRRMRFPDGLEWVVNDVPAVVELARDLRRDAGMADVSFTSSLDRMDGADVLFASGSMQFIANPWAPLARLSRRPRHALVDKVPAYDMPSAVTLQNMGPATVPNHLFNRDDFVAAFQRLGYRLVDAWTSPGIGCSIPFEQAHSIPAYSGFYFRA